MGPDVTGCGHTLNKFKKDPEKLCSMKALVVAAWTIS